MEAEEDIWNKVCGKSPKRGKAKMAEPFNHPTTLSRG
jgi:hypothetical protein